MGAGVATNPHCLKFPSPHLGRARLQLERVRIFRSRLHPILSGFSARSAAPDEEPGSPISAEVASGRFSDGPEAGYPAPTPFGSLMLSKVALGERSIPFPDAPQGCPCRLSSGPEAGCPASFPFGSSGLPRFPSGAKHPFPRCPARLPLPAFRRNDAWLPRPRPVRGFGEVASAERPLSKVSPKSPPVRFRGAFRGCPPGSRPGLCRSCLR